MAAHAPPSAIARRLGREIVFRPLPGGRRGLSAIGHSKILVAPSGCSARDEATIAHELCEAELTEKLPDELHERFCERGAAALLLPRADFLSSCMENRWEMPGVKREWPWASWELIIWRAAELLPGLASAKWSRGHLVARRCLHASHVTNAEFAAARDATKKGRGLVLSAGHLALAWRLVGAGNWVISISFPS